MAQISINTDHGPKLFDVVDVPINDAEEIDDKIFFKCGQQRSTRGPPLARYMLLVVIVATCKSHLNQEYGDINEAKSLLNDYKGLDELLKKGWVDGSFSDIRSLKILQSPLLSTNDDAQRATVNSWDVPYQGNSSKALIEIIQETSKDDHKSNLLPIVQSSGMGKSRTVDETAKKVFTIPLNLREMSDHSGYPHADAAIVEFISKNAFSTKFAANTAFTILLTEIFERTAEWVTAQESIQGVPEAKYAEVARQWHSYIGNSRQSFYQNIVDRATQKSKTIGVELDSINTSLLNAAQHLQYALKTATDCNHPCTAIYFDEVHSLIAKAVSDTPNYSAYYALCALLKQLKTRGFFAIFLSTHSHITTLAPPSSAPPSSALRSSFRGEKGPELQPPFVELPFDVYKGGPIITEGEKTLEEVCHSGFIARFGRPLFWARYEMGGRAVKEDIVNFAGQKLTRMMYPNRPLANPNTRFAIFSTRLLLSFEPHRVETRTFEAGQVASHLRIAYSVPRHREYMRSGSSSEPLVAEAAARLMNRHSTNEIIDNFCGQMDSDLIEKGERGELVARLLVTLAHDQAIRNHYPDSPTIYTRPVPVCEFLKALIATEYHDVVLDSQPQDDPRSTTNLLRDTFKDAYMNFTHFSKAGDSSVLTTSAAWRALARANAWQCFDRQEGVDIAIPVHFADKGGKLRCETSSCIFIQIKNKVNETVIYVDPEELGFFKDSTVIRPFIVITMEFGVQRRIKPLPEVGTSASATTHTAKRKAAKAKASAQDAVSKLKVGRKEDNVTTAGLRSGNNKRYDISIVGCSPTVYGIIAEEDSDKLTKVLAYRELFSEHPRQSETALGLVRRMKPMYFTGHDSYDWAKDSDEGKAGVYAHVEQEEGVSTGKRKNRE